MKRTILLFTAVLLLSMASAFAQGGTTGPLTWKINNGTLTISGEGAMPDYYKLGDAPWYEHRLSIISILVENGITSIGNCAFYNFRNLTAVTLSNTVISIGEWAFRNCKSLPSITIPNGTISIKGDAFYSCEALSSVFISKSVTSIAVSAFHSCSTLLSIEVNSENQSYTSENGVLFNKDKTILIRFPQGKGGEYSVPNSVKTIGYESFYFCGNLTSVTVPNSVTTIEFSAFLVCSNLISIAIPNSVASIGANAFYNCNNLTSIALPNKLTDIEEATFANCASLTSITIPNNVTSIGGLAFSSCRSLTSITILGSVTSFGYQSLACRSLKKITNLNPVPVNISNSVFYDVNQGACTLEVPMNSVSAYQEANVWKNFNIVGIDVGIEPLEADIVKIYPNPTTGELRVESGELRVENVEVFDIYGRKHEGTKARKDESTKEINISGLPAGIYFIKISTENGIFVEKIIKN